MVIMMDVSATGRVQPGETVSISRYHSQGMSRRLYTLKLERKLKIQPQLQERK